MWSESQKSWLVHFQVVQIQQVFILTLRNKRLVNYIKSNNDPIAESKMLYAAFRLINHNRGQKHKGILLPMKKIKELTISISLLEQKFYLMT